ncbi:MAG: hypothetical protein GQ523_11030 [Methanophagales archaeon]|jgi:hypothetical protein|nr:hypothetical protein [Methanophagales archaeon]
MTEKNRAKRKRAGSLPGNSKRWSELVFYWYFARYHGRNFLRPSARQGNRFTGLYTPFLNFDRMYIYAVLFTLSFALNEITIANTGVIASGAYAWLISGIIMIVIGVVYLVRFLRKYPLPVKGVYHDSTN